MLSESLFAQAWREFSSTTCPACDGPKKTQNAFCRTCYFRLPKEMQSALWRRFGKGFEEAYDEAKDWFKEEKNESRSARPE